MTKQPPTKKEDPLAQIFNDKELADRKRCIQTLKTFTNSYEAAARALQDVKEHRLYRPYRSIVIFCETECGWKRARLYQVVAYLKVKSKLPPASLPLVDNERVARELANVPEEQRESVLNEAAATGKVTAKKIKQLAGKHPSISDKDGENGKIIELDRTGYPIPEAAMMIWNRREEAEKLLKHFRDGRDMMQELMTMQSGASPDPLYVEVRLNECYAKMSMVCTELKRAIPYAVCTTCQGVHPETCVNCKHRGMISKHHYEINTPIEMKEIRKKAQQQ